MIMEIYYFTIGKCSEYSKSKSVQKKYRSIMKEPVKVTVSYDFV